MTERWSILLSKSAAETVAERSLREVGYRTYLPWFRKMVQPHGRDRRPSPVMRPIFPSIVFVQAWMGFGGRPLTGVDKCMQSYRGGPPATMLDTDIAILMQREREGAFDEIHPPRGAGLEHLEVGGTYEYGWDGLDLALSAVLEELSPDGQATVRMMMFGRETRVQIDARALNPLTAGRGVP